MLREALPEMVTGSVPGPKAAELLKRRDAAIPKAMCGTTYPICMGRGEGAMLEDVDGNRFLDWIGGVGVLNIKSHVRHDPEKPPVALWHIIKVDLIQPAIYLLLLLLRQIIPEPVLI